MNSDITATNPQKHNESLALVRDLCEGRLTRDPFAPLITPSPEPARHVVPIDQETFYYECRACKYRYGVRPSSCPLCGCSYFDRRREV